MPLRALFLVGTCYDVYLTGTCFDIYFTDWYALLAHLSRRLKGEVIVYEGIRRPSVVCQHFQTTSPLKP